MSALIALGLCLVATALTVFGARMIARARRRADAVQGGALMLVAIALLVIASSQSALAWIFTVVLMAFGAVRLTRTFAGAARGRVGVPLSTEETERFLARADEDPIVNQLTADQPEVVIRPYVQPRPDQPAADEDLDQPPSL